MAKNDHLLCWLDYGDVNEKTKGTKGCVIRQTHKFEDYKNCQWSWA